MFDFLYGNTNHYLFAGRFVVYTLGIVLFIGTIRDMIELRSKDARVRAVTRAHQLTILSACVALLLSSPAQFHVMRRLFGVPKIGFPTDALLLASVGFTIIFFLYAQITRARNRHVAPKRIRFGVYASLLAVVLIACIGLGIDV
jgi:hypothetical protein